MNKSWTVLNKVMVIREHFLENGNFEVIHYEVNKWYKINGRKRIVLKIYDQKNTSPIKMGRKRARGF